MYVCILNYTRNIKFYQLQAIYPIYHNINKMDFQLSSEMSFHE